MEQLTARNIVAAVTALGIIIVVGLGFVIRSGANSQSQVQDLITIVQGYQKAYSNQSYVYGNAVLQPAILINSGKVDPNIVSGGNVNSRWQTPIVTTGNGSGFSSALTGIPYSNCTDLFLDQSLAQYITSILITGGTPRVPPVQPDTAATDCGASGVQNITVNFQGHP